MTNNNESYGIDDKELAKLLYSPVCNYCKYFTIEGSMNSGIPICEAFPNGIPEEIWRGDNNHKKPYTGDHGIQFEQTYKAE